MPGVCLSRQTMWRSGVKPPDEDDDVEPDELVDEVVEPDELEVPLVPSRRSLQSLSDSQPR